MRSENENGNGMDQGYQESKPFLSVILPIYNVKPYLRRCVDPLLAEAYHDCEFILVDDGSTDGCSVMCDEYASRDERIRVIHQPNGGLSYARNVGLDAAAGEYIFWVDPDDYTVQGALEVIAKALHRHPVDILKFNYVSQPGGSEVLSAVSPGLYEEKEVKGELASLLMRRFYDYLCSVWSHVYRRSFVLENRLRFISEREIGSEDILFNLQALFCADSLYAISGFLYCHDCRTGSLTERYRIGLADQYRRLYHRMMESVVQNGAGEDGLTALSCFYVWGSYYVIMYNEARITRSHSRANGIENIRHLLRQKELTEALRSVSLHGETWKKHLIYFLIKAKSAYGLWAVMLLAGKVRVHLDETDA